MATDSQLNNSSKVRNVAITEAINSALSAAVAGTISEIVFYGLDSYKVMKQMGEKVRISRLFRGAVPLAVMSAGPSYAAFFICYNPLRNCINEKLGSGYESISVLVSSIIAGVPSTIVYVPADVIKKQLLLSPRSSTGAVPTVLDVARQQYRLGGISRLFLGWQANILRDVPFMMLKMSLYEGIARLYLKAKHKHSNTAILNADALTSLEASGVGFTSGMLTAIATCPIDCVNSRIKSGELAQYNVLQAHVEIVKRNGFTALFRGVVPRAAILGLGSTMFWYLQATILHSLNGDTVISSTTSNSSGSSSGSSSSSISASTTSSRSST